MFLLIALCAFLQGYYEFHVVPALSAHLYTEHHQH